MLGKAISKFKSRNSKEGVIKSVQKGQGSLSLLVSIVLVLCSLLWLLSDYLPAQADELKEVVSLAATSPEAKAAVVATLKQTPNPNRMELRHMRNRVNEIIVTDTARKVTGDTTLETPSERDASREREAVARLAAIESKPWSKMSNDERAEFLASKWSILLGAVLFVGFVLVSLRMFRQAERGY